MADEPIATPEGGAQAAPPGADRTGGGGPESRAVHPRELLRIREDVPGWLRWALGVVPIAVLLGVWWLLTGSGPAEGRIISSVILPSPLEVLHSFPKLWFDRALTRNAGLSLSRVLAGFAIGVAVAFPLGLLMGAFSKIKAMFNPLAVFGAYLPIPALVPLTMSLLGTGEGQKMGFLALAFVVYLLPLIVTAVDNVDDVYLKTAFTLGANTSQVVRKVLLAISWPDIYQALRMGFGIGWSYIILAELVGLDGLGGIIMVSQRQGPREHIYLVLLVIVLIAFVTDKLWQLVGQVLFPYRERRR